MDAGIATVAAALIAGATTLTLQLRRLRTDNTRQHDEGAERLHIALLEAKAHTDKAIQPVRQEVSEVKEKVARIDGKLDTIVSFYDIPRL